MSAANDLTRLTTSRSFFDSGETGEVFPTYQAFSFFLRRHAKELCDDGAYIPRQGSAASLVDPEIISLSIRRIMAREGSMILQVLESA